MKLKTKMYICLTACSIFIIYKFSKLIDAKENYCFDNNCDDYEISDSSICIIITFANANSNYNLQNSFAITIKSLFEHSSSFINLFIVGDIDSYNLANKILIKEVKNTSKYELKNLNVDEMAKKIENIIRPMQDQFSYKPGAYYNNALFFLSLALHKVLNSNFDKVIMLDADLKFLDDVTILYKYFDKFSPENIIGIAHEMQPVYRHTFYNYRSKHPGTRVGEPPPNGLTGFNSGVLLLYLSKIRASSLYNDLLSPQSIKQISAEYEFKGHLGDQDFFTLASMKYEQLFYILPCQWNRQLCAWWKNNGYADVFDFYFKCEDPIKLYHGNCGTKIP